MLLIVSQLFSFGYLYSNLSNKHHYTCRHIHTKEDNGHYLTIQPFPDYLLKHKLSDYRFLFHRPYFVKATKHSIAEKLYLFLEVLVYQKISISEHLEHLLKYLYLV